jgi:hypothetical protein
MNSEARRKGRKRDEGMKKAIRGIPSSYNYLPDPNLIELTYIPGTS